MRARNDSASSPVRNKDGELVMCPIADWSDYLVYEYSGMAAAGLVVADALFEGGAKRKVGKCGARHGCFTCLQAEANSLANRVEFDDRYAYARGLVRFNRFLRNIRWDWSRRHWVGRTIQDGSIAIQPDTFYPGTIR